MNRNDFIVAPEEVFSMYVAKPQTDVPETELVKGSLSHLVLSLIHISEPTRP